MNTETALNYYVTTVAAASWEHLAGILYYLEEHAALDKVKKYFQRQPG